MNEVTFDTMLEKNPHLVKASNLFIELDKCMHSLESREMMIALDNLEQTYLWFCRAISIEAIKKQQEVKTKEKVNEE